MRRLTRPACPNPVAIRTNYKHPENKLALQQCSHNKCMYCESHISHVYFGDVEHIRPKAEDKFPELEFEWSNHGYCCARCNNEKRDEFDNDCPLIDPYSEDPNTHLLAFGSILRHKSGSERGALTISTIGLNRPELIERRSIRINELQNAIDACYRTRNSTIRDNLLAALTHESDADKEFSMVAAALLAANEL
ncbi:TPA: HNH endonuclease [Enterobacter kobei]|uniref:HNH endonuclease n=1 Tax=Enterobacteriaceae TaxID=543 RepID=UPI0025789ABB|nr:HNH endonuclease [Citrobacter sp. Cpo107]MDM2808955.1 HNH endonuclease [Citrobacter sp. Cpo107]HDC4309692.1 HNH endonuclease [Enterobacter kobei]